jgi:rsbT co-antagonist protein RsbR
MNDMSDLSLILRKNKKKILEVWINKQLLNVSLREDLLTNEELREQSNELLNVILDTISDGNMAESLESEQFDKVREVVSGMSITRARQGFSPRETGVYVFSLKEAFQHILQEEIKDDPSLLYQAILRINTLMDNLGIFTFESFLKGREEVILRQTNEITEISTPVIRVWDGILALPIIGTLDSARTQTVMENLLQEIVESGSTIAILDISGVPAVDSLVAQHLIKTVAATKLMGAECIISGIRPEIAQTVVHLGIDLSGVVTKPALSSALRYAFSLLKLEVKKIQKDKSVV